MRTTRALLAVAAAAAITATTGLTGAQAATGCPTGWGSLREGSSPSVMAAATIRDVRSGRHACFDRLVVDVNGKIGRAYDVRYARSVSLDGSGDRIPLRGGAFLQVTVRAPAHDRDYRPTYRPANRREAVSTSGYRTLRQVAWGGTYEGISTLGVGVRARLPFRVMVLPGPGTGSRVVLDVAHRW